ncbi:Lrp/AsnC family transcriptional regulator [Nonomuraea zeae]|uniref:Lrp/AsnC family transcriptional regulator n=1 Tax=Nonomuraea zeae TaxID=1642303 RepID=A0A5S4FN26_9ACTN|nr:Lrp/AsnC family transcriptional regulator [Nonomuraea zeae]TMR22029.1 Lrp/AsnC family transcriptional regulator [Nonomuraea zeae]
MLDDVDRGLIHALHIDGRAPFSRIASVLGVSTQTVTRRYRRLTAEVALRVVGLPDTRHSGQAQWMLRLTAAPHSAQNLARALARRADTSWVKLISGGTEIFTIVTTPDHQPDRSLLLHDIPRTAGITAVSAHCLLHTYRGGPAAWRGRPNVLDERQQRLLEPAVQPRGERHAVTRSDAALLAALRHDGRASQGDLAKATGWSAATVARRVGDLRASGALFFDIELDAAALGIAVQALLWMSVAPAHLDRVATTLAGHAELAFVAATTGSTNLTANALCTDPAALHRYLTQGLGSVGGIHTIETAPVLRTVKATAPMTMVVGR